MWIQLLPAKRILGALFNKLSALGGGAVTFAWSLISLIQLWNYKCSTMKVMFMQIS